MTDYRKIVIGAVERLPVIAHDPTGYPIDLSGVDVTVRIFGPGAGGALVVPDAVCVSTATQAYYDWDTAGLTAGRYQIQFTFDTDDLLQIEPADPFTVLLAARLGGP
jgi:hypothetical protein